MSKKNQEHKAKITKENPMLTPAEVSALAKKQRQEKQAKMAAALGNPVPLPDVTVTSKKVKKVKTVVAEKVEKPTKSSDGLKTYSVYGVEVALPFRPNRLSGKTKAMQKAGKTAAEIAAYWIGEFKNGTLERRPVKASAAV